MRIAAGALQSLIANDAMPQRSATEAQGRLTQAMAHQMGMAGAAINRRELVKALEKLNKNAKAYQLSDEFMIMEENGAVYVALVDKYTGEVKRKLLPERFLSFLEDDNAGVILDSKG
ncbi:MAG: flagellar protein FlaG [Peptococcaceae bacterium]|nr:flagellar protein FlaG [Peptococcaceae bacterium]